MKSIEILKPMSQGYSISLSKVHFNPKDKGVLNGVDIDVKAGEFVSLVGRNGQGKSSIMKAISGELDHWTGEIKVGNLVIREPIGNILPSVGIVHQFVQYDLIDELSIYKNIQIRAALITANTTILIALD